MMSESRVHLLWNGRKQPASTVGSVRRPAAWMQSAPWTGKIVLDEEKCNNCGRCVKACPTDAWKATPAFEVSFGGLFGNRVYKGENYLPLVTSRNSYSALPMRQSSSLMTMPIQESVSA